MGVVWRARDQLLDRDVAIKEVHIADTLTEAERATAFQRTLREAKTAARLNHPAVVTVYDVAEDGGRPWIVMQLVHAQSLDQVLATSGPLSPRRAADMARQLLSALSVAHAAGVMHRDVKPSNVLLGSDDRAVLTDFGIATFADDPKLTQTGMVMGSPGFTAPERIRGEDASPASDLWSLGATLFAAVEGHGPFEQRGGAITTMSAIINEEAPEAPAAGALGPVIAALLRREPVDRPDASAAARMIADVLPRLPDRPPGTPTGYEATALSASSRPASPQPGSAPPGSAPPGSAPPGSVSPGSVRPRAPQPGENAFAYEPTVVKPPDSPAGATGPPGSIQASAAQTAPTTPQPSQGRPPDFSSWYNQSPRSGASPGGSGSGYPPPAGYGPTGWSGQGSQQAQGAPAWSGAEYAPPRRRRSGLGWKAAVVALAIIGAAAGAATVVLLHRDHSGSPQAPGPGDGNGFGVGIGIRILLRHAPARDTADHRRDQPAGHRAAAERVHHDLAAGRRQRDRGLQHRRADQLAEDNERLPDVPAGPDGPNTNILIDLTPHTYQDMLQEAQYIEQRSISRFPGYHRVGMAATNVRGTTGSWWKFTWNNKGVQQEALDVLFVAHTSAGTQSYALYMTAPVSQFDQMRPTFDEEAETFATLPGGLTCVPGERGGLSSSG